jgi:hypothetical protein
MRKKQALNATATDHLVATRLLMAGAAFLLLMLPALPAAAQKTDVITLDNGDTITGEIKSIDKGLIQLSTTGMGTVQIKWAYVVAIETDKTLEVELSSGQRVYGSVQPAAEPRTVDVARGAETVPIHLDDVADAWPIGKTFWQKQNGKLDLGFSFTRASDQLQFNLNVHNTFEGRGFKVPLTLTSAVTRVDGETTTNRQVVEGAYLHELGWRKWFGIALGGYQRNDELDLDFRVTAGGGAGRYLTLSSRYNWAAYGAVVATQERYVADPGQTGASLVAGTNANVFMYGEHDVIFNTGLQVLPSLTGSSRVRLEFNSSLSYEVVHDFYLGFNFYDQFDSNPPTEAAQRNDFGFSTTVGYKW